MTPPPIQLRALIVDDEVHGRDLVRHLLQAHADIAIVGEAGNGARAIEEIRRCRPDLLFLDIRMPKLNGLQVVDALEEEETLPIVVFTTAHDEYAVQAFERCALDYLLKPFDQERFDRTLARARERLVARRDAEMARKLREVFSPPAPVASEAAGSSRPTAPSPFLTRIVIKENGRVFFVPAASVDWFEATGNYVGVRSGGKTHLVHESLTALEEKLDPHAFLRIHRSTIVNVDRIKELQPFTNGEFIVILHDGSKLKLSRSYRERAERILGLQ